MVKPTSSTPPAAAGILLAGGRSRRMGGCDKAFVRLGHKPLLEHVIDRAAPQVSRLLLSINGDPARYSDYPLLTVADCLPDFGGPLAGILSAMHWLRQHDRDCGWLASFAGDTPFVPVNLVATLQAAVAREGTALACPRSAGRAHPTCALWSLQLLPALERFLRHRRGRKVQAFVAGAAVSWVDFEYTSVDPFLNINTPADLKAAQFLGHAP